MSFIPIIDLSVDSDEKQAALIRHALSSVGFFIVQGAGIDPDDIDGVFEHGKTFFNLPLAEKEATYSDGTGLGYVRNRSQALGEGKKDHKEYCANGTQKMPEPYNSQPMAMATMQRFYRSCHDVSQRLLELFALALDLPREHFRQSHSFGLKTAFIQIHYPALSPEDQKKIGDQDIRAGEHKDWGTLTMLFQEPDGPPGLQVYLPTNLAPSGWTPSLTSKQREVPVEYIPKLTGYTSDLPGWEWFDAPACSKGSFLVNIGLAMELWSSGTYRATMHRVIFPDMGEQHSNTMNNGECQPGEESANGADAGAVMRDRYSIAYFVQPDDDVQLQRVLPGGVIDTSEKAITSGELFKMKMSEAIDRVKRMTEASAVAVH